MNRCVLALASESDRASVALTRLDESGRAVGEPVVLADPVASVDTRADTRAEARFAPLFPVGASAPSSRSPGSDRPGRTPGAGPKDLRRGAAPRRSANRLGRFVRELLERERLTADRIARIGLATGPAAFSSLRVAVGLAQGMACGLDVPLVGIGNLAATALAAAPPDRASRVWVSIDARMGECWWGIYDIHPGRWPVEVQAPVFTTSDAVREAWDRAEGGSEGAMPTLPRLRHDGPAAFDAGHLARLAAMAGPDHWRAPEAIRPSYLREKVALDVDEQQALRRERDAARRILAGGAQGNARATGS